VIFLTWEIKMAKYYKRNLSLEELELFVNDLFMCVKVGGDSDRALVDFAGTDFEFNTKKELTKDVVPVSTWKELYKSNETIFKRILSKTAIAFKSLLEKSAGTISVDNFCSFDWTQVWDAVTKEIRDRDEIILRESVKNLVDFDWNIRTSSKCNAIYMSESCEISITKWVPGGAIKFEKHDKEDEDDDKILAIKIAQGYRDDAVISKTEANALSTSVNYSFGINGSWVKHSKFDMCLTSDDEELSFYGHPDFSRLAEGVFILKGKYYENKSSSKLVEGEFEWHLFKKGSANIEIKNSIEKMF